MDGRGRWYRSSWDKRDTTADRLRLPIDFVRKRWGLDNAVLASMLWHRGKDKVGEIGLYILPGLGVKLDYNFKGEPVETLIRFAYSAQNLGGRRTWWVCPSCGRRCGVLYCERLFVCRKCAGVDYYRTQQTGDVLTTLDNRLRRVGRKLGAADASNDVLPPRPRYMHSATYERLAGEYLELQRISEVYWLAEMGYLLGLDVEFLLQATG